MFGPMSWSSWPMIRDSYCLHLPGLPFNCCFSACFQGYPENAINFDLWRTRCCSRRLTTVVYTFALATMRRPDPAYQSFRLSIVRANLLHVYVTQFLPNFIASNKPDRECHATSFPGPMACWTAITPPSSGRCGFPAASGSPFAAPDLEPADFQVIHYPLPCTPVAISVHPLPMRREVCEGPTCPSINCDGFRRACGQRSPSCGS